MMRSVLQFFSRNRHLPKKFTVPPVHDYFRHTSNTWLFNAREQYANRYLEFNVSALIDEAIRAAKASSCVGFSKLSDGVSNRVFEIKLDNGEALIAKLPFPLAGPAHFTTASEVATMRFMGEALDLPVPKVLAWSSHADKTPVRSEFIIMEKMEGRPLSDAWDDFSTEETTDILGAIVEIERCMTQTYFHALGSVYYSKDIPHGVRSIPMTGYGVDGYCIGPSVDRCFWHSGRAQLNINRGPWKDIAEYTRSVIDCEIAWLKKYAKPHPRDSPLFRSVAENDPEKHIELLNKYALVVPSLIPRDEYHCPRLWHPDLNEGNLLVAPIDGRPHITGILDWQGACVDLLLMAGDVPQCIWDPSSKYIPHPIPGDESIPLNLPANYHSLPEPEQMQAEKELKAARRFNEYMLLTKEENPTLHAHRMEYMFVLSTFPLTYASETWDLGLSFFKMTLIGICDMWDPHISTDKPCPISFSESERAANETAMAIHQRNRNAWMLYSEIGVEPEGWVEVDELEEARRSMEVVREKYLQSLPESECEDARRRWPFQDGALSITARSCR